MGGLQILPRLITTHLPELLRASQRGPRMWGPLGCPKQTPALTPPSHVTWPGPSPVYKLKQTVSPCSVVGRTLETPTLGHSRPARPYLVGVASFFSHLSSSRSVITRLSPEGHCLGPCKASYFSILFFCLNKNVCVC